MIHVGDCLEWLRSLPDNSVDAIVTDPPYGLGKEPDPRAVLRAWLDGEEYKPGGSGFMGRAWDAFVPSPVVWQECLRVLKPGGHLLSFAGTRTYDWIVMGVRLAGFEVRDMVGWLYGSGFPKSLDVSKAIDREAGAVRSEVIGNRGLVRWSANAPDSQSMNKGMRSDFDTVNDITAPATEAAAQWSGWGTALKPSCEPVVLARKPLQGTVAANVLRWGTGGINVDAGRVGTDGGCKGATEGPKGAVFGTGLNESFAPTVPGLGRWPANIVHDGSEEVEAVFPQSTAEAQTQPRGPGGIWSPSSGAPVGPQYGDAGGSASRFYYAAKASREEREYGLSHLPRTIIDASRELDSAGRENPRTGAGRSGEGRANIHPTVKPVDLMRWLTRLVTPPGGTVVDPYTGSGTTGVACALEGFRFLGCELETPHALIAHERIRTALEEVQRAKVETPTGQLLLLPGLNPP